MAHIWMEHRDTKGRAMLPDIEYWRENGWAPCDGPYPEPDLTRDPRPPVEAVTPVVSRKPKTEKE